jgi:hypothetical protein
MCQWVIYIRLRALESSLATCAVCGSDIGTFADQCETCGEPVSKPNVRLANRPAEKTALTQRFDKAVKDAETRGVADLAQKFHNAMNFTVAVINVDIFFLREFLTKDNLLYASYHQGVRAATRKAAALEFDRERNGVDGTLFGQMASFIVTAALSTECRGLISYGPFCMQLREVAIAKRASLMEENSFQFVRNHKLLPNSTIPSGYSADWLSRPMLASAKLIPRLNASTTESEFQSILLGSTGDRQTDDFVEVHIYGGFDNRAIEKISGKMPTERIEIAMWAVVKELMSKSGKVAEEY